MTKKDKAFILLIISLLIVVWFVFFLVSSVVSRVTFSIPESYKIIAEDTSSKWLNLSQNIEPQDLKNRIILLDFWTYACVNCLHMVPEIKKLEKEFGDRLTVIGVHSGKFDNEKLMQSIRDAVIRYDITHPVINDADLRIWRSFQVSAWPTTILINPAGDIKKVYKGEGHGDEMREDIKKLVKKFQYSLNKNPLPITLEKNKITRHILKFPAKLEYSRNFSYKDNISSKPAIFIANSGKNNIIIISLSGKILLTIGSQKQGFVDGDFENASFNAPRGLLYRNKILYVADTGNHALRKVDFVKGQVSTIVGSGTRGSVLIDSTKAKHTDLASPWDLEFFPDNNNIIIANAGTHQLLRYNIDQDTISPFAGNGVENITDGLYPYNALAQPSGLSAFNGKLYFVDSETSALRVADKQGHVNTLIGKGLFEFGHQGGEIQQALMQHPLGLFADDTGVYVADTYNHIIRKYNLLSYQMKDYSGSGNKGAELNGLKGISYNEPEDIISILTQFYIADTNNNRIVVINRNNGKGSILNVMPPLKLPKEGLLEYLPNLKKVTTQIDKSNVEITLLLNLKKGWKINEMGPSFFNLVEVVGEKEANLITHYDWKSIKKGMVKLPELSSNHEYYLQGTVYYCEDIPSSLCLVRSYEQKIQPQKNSKNNQIEINFVYN